MGSVCPSGTKLQDGKCYSPCPADYTLNDGDCIIECPQYQINSYGTGEGTDTEGECLLITSNKPCVMGTDNRWYPPCNQGFTQTLGTCSNNCVNSKVQSVSTNATVSLWTIVTIIAIVIIIIIGIIYYMRSRRRTTSEVVDEFYDYSTIPKANTMNKYDPIVYV